MKNNSLHITEEENQVRLEIEIVPRSKSVQFTTLIATIFIILITIYRIIASWISISEAVFFDILFTVILVLLSWYFIKLFLWYRGGKEIFIIGKNHLSYISNYRFFNQKKGDYTFKDLYIVYYSEDSRDDKVDVDILDDLFKEDNKKVIIGFELDDKKIVETSAILTYSELRRMADVLDGKELRKRK